MAMLVEISHREVPQGQPVEWEAVVSEDGVPVFTSWQPWDTPELAKEAVLRVFSNTEPVTLKVTDLAGGVKVEEIR